MERIKAEAAPRGYVETIFGRKCFIPGIRDANPMRRAGAERQAINAPLQGSAADIIKRAMGRLPAALAKAGLKARMLLQVHDELLFETPEGEIEATAAAGQGGHGSRLRAALRAVGAARRRNRLGAELGRGALTRTPPILVASEGAQRPRWSPLTHAKKVCIAVLSQWPLCIATLKSI